MTVYLDFDGTIVEHEYPSIGPLNVGCINVVENLQKAGHNVILNTLRSEFMDGSFEEAKLWIKQWETLSKIESSNSKVYPGKWDFDKFLNSGILILDDQCDGIPLKKSTLSNGLMVDWDKVDIELRKNGIY